MNVAQMIHDLEAEVASIQNVIEVLRKWLPGPISVPLTPAADLTPKKKPYSKSNPRRPKAFQCPNCPKAYTSKSALGYHQRENHQQKANSEAPLIQCLDCRMPNWFKDRKALDAHRVEAHGPINRAARA